MDLFASLRDTHSDADAVKACIEGVRAQLQGITSMIHDLSKQSDSTELVGDIIEQELAGMDKAIEEAANRIEEMLSKSRASDSGIKLEVNEKILDACTALMRCIRILVQKSRVLQAEIVSLGKGNRLISSINVHVMENHFVCRNCNGKRILQKKPPMDGGTHFSCKGKSITRSFVASTNNSVFYPKSVAQGANFLV